MNILIVSIHVRFSTQAVALAAGNLKAGLSAEIQQNTRLLDLYLPQSTEQMLAEIEAAQAELVAFSVYLWNRQQVLSLAAELKTRGKPPFILLGGPEASADSLRLLQTGTIDAVLRGEGEESFAQLVDRLLQGRSLDGIAGLCCSPKEPLAAACSCTIDKLVSPWLNGRLQPVANGVLWEVARGCPFNCSFCYDAKGMAGVRPFPQARLAEELDCFVRQGVEQVWVLDSTFNAPPRRGHKLLQLLIDKAPELHYHLEAKAEFIDKRTLELASRLSCSIQVGLQTADPEVLAAMNRKIDPERFWAGVELLAASGLTFGLDLIYGLPGDSYAGFTASLARVLRFRPNQIDIFPLAVLPGTALHAQRTHFALTSDDQPPYLLQKSSDFSLQQMHDCALLQAAVDLFYNRGRAVGFLVPICASLQLPPLRLLEIFRDWFIETQGGEESLCQSSELSLPQILTLQQNFFHGLFKKAGQLNLLALVADIIDYHYHYAEALLGEETLPQTAPPSHKLPLRRAPGVRLITFRSDILGALETEEIDLSRWGKCIEQVPTAALMIRRGRQVFSEVLTEEFAELLRRAQTEQSRRQLMSGLPGKEVAELLDFALAEGLLVAANVT